MTVLFDIVRGIHVLAGGTALITLWIPMATQKGGKVHVRAGWVYVASMATVAASAILMGVIRILDPATNSSQRASSAFLIFVGVLAASSAWFGVRALRDKKRVGRHRGLLDLAWGALLLASGVLASGLGLYLASPLLTWFPTVGIFLGARHLTFWLRPPREKRHWWYAHMAGMFASCISTITAFVVLGAPRLLDMAALSPVAWFAPTAVLVPVLLVWQRRYRARFSA